jgi:hypothetical protein
MKQFLTMILIGFGLSLQAQSIDTIRVGHKFSRINQLEIGTKQDAIYSEIDGTIRSVTIMSKTTEMVIIDGKEYLSFRHRWGNGNPEMEGDFYYLCEPETLRPVQHIRNSKRNGKEAFSFQGMKIVGLDSAKDNAKKDFKLDLKEPTFNWEIDLETYSVLPMKDGYEAVMNFYHPGGSAPNFYNLKVIGSEKLILPNGSEMDCWILFTDYGGTQPTRFWYTKVNQNFVKMEGEYNKLKIRKVRLF